MTQLLKLADWDFKTVGISTFKDLKVHGQNN